MQGNWEIWRNSRSSKIQKFSQENVETFGGPRTKSKFVKWSASRKRLRTAVLHQLHGLPVEFRIRFKLACLTYKALSTIIPTYLHALLTPYTPPRCLRSSGTRLLAEPRYRTIVGSRAFHFSAPREWNRLPLSLRSINSLPSLKKRLKTHYFFLAFKEFLRAL